MIKAKTMLAAAAAALSIQAVSAHAAAPGACVTRAELGGLVGFVLPSALQSMIGKCSPTLGRSSYLASRAPRLAETLRADRDAAWPMAKQAFVKIGGRGDPSAAKAFDMLSDKALQPIIEEVLAAELTNGIKVESCKDIDAIMAALEPLPAANLTLVVTEALMIAGRKDKKLSTCDS